MKPEELGQRLNRAQAWAAKRRDALSRKLGARDRDAEELARNEEEAAGAKGGRELRKKAGVLLEKVAAGGRMEVVRSLREVVERCVCEILGDDYTFDVLFETKRNAASAEFVVGGGGFDGEASDPVVSRGGGVVDVVSFALRVALLELWRPKVCGPLVLDEPFRHLSQESVPAAARMVASVASVFDRQIIVVTHQSSFALEGVADVVQM